MRAEVIAWACLSLALISAEVMAPGVFLLWLGIAAAVVFGVVLLVPGIPVLWQALGFIVLSFASIAVYRKHFRQDAERNDQPLLNRRAEHFIGKNYVLESAIVNGSGRLKIGDAFWTVTGEDLPVGTRVRVVQSDGMVLTVVAD
jgi:membrane protein implicated in regulation of membrane protease activity